MIYSTHPGTLALLVVKMQHRSRPVKGACTAGSRSAIPIAASHIAASNMVGSEKQTLTSRGHRWDTSGPVSQHHFRQLTWQDDLASMCHKMAQLSGTAWQHQAWDAACSCWSHGGMCCCHGPFAQSIASCVCRQACCVCQPQGLHLLSKLIAWSGMQASAEDAPSVRLTYDASLDNRSCRSRNVLSDGFVSSADAACYCW